MRFSPGRGVRERYHRLFVVAIGKAIPASISRGIPEDIEAVTRLFAWAATDVPAKNLDG
jgi:hypothetical protein